MEMKMKIIELMEIVLPTNTKLDWTPRKIKELVELIGSKTMVLVDQATVRMSTVVVNCNQPEPVHIVFMNQNHEKLLQLFS